MDNLNRLLQLKNNFSVKIITGIGSSALLRNFAETLKNRGVPSTEIIFVDCAAEHAPKNFRQLYNFVSERATGLEKFFLFVNEIDRVTECEKAVNALFVGAPAEIYVTGSSDLLIEKISALLPENCDAIKLYPPSLPEFAKNFPAEDPSEILRRFLHFGSLPVTTGADEKSLPAILRGAAYEFMFGLAEKNSLQKLEMFRRMIDMTAERVGTAVSLTAISEDLRKFGITPNFNSVKSYFSVGTGIFVKIPRTPATVKIFCIDNGLLRAFRNFSEIDETILIQNAVCIELLRRGFNVSCGKGIVDFAATRGDEKIFVKTLPVSKKVSAGRAAQSLCTNVGGEKILISMTPQKKFDGVTNITLQEFLSGA